MVRQTYTDDVDYEGYNEDGDIEIENETIEDLGDTREDADEQPAKQERDDDFFEKYGLVKGNGRKYCDNEKMYEHMCEYKQKVYVWRDKMADWEKKQVAARIRLGMEIPKKLEKWQEEADYLVPDMTDEEARNLTDNVPAPDKPEIPRYLAECIMSIATHLCYRPNFSGYTYREDFIADAIENCIMYIDNFDETRFNKPFAYFNKPFAYFTQICWQSFVRRIQIEKHQSVVKGMFLKDCDFSDTSVIDEDTERLMGEDVFKSNHVYVKMADAEQQKLIEKQKKKAEEKQAKKDEKIRKTDLFAVLSEE